jgi:hypothetical protein
MKETFVKEIAKIEPKNPVLYNFLVYKDFYDIHLFQLCLFQLLVYFMHFY